MKKFDRAFQTGTTFPALIVKTPTMKKGDKWGSRSVGRKRNRSFQTDFHKTRFAIENFKSFNIRPRV